MVKEYPNLRRFFQPGQKLTNPYLKKLLNLDSRYNIRREDIETCCEIAIRYNMVVDEEKGLLKGGRSIYVESTLNELRIARLFEKYFGKGCLSWDPTGNPNNIGEF
jgi:hypothetical protein